MQLTAWQHIFSTVERDRSPTGRRGYQTLYYSQEGLDDEDLRILENRSQYYSTPEDPVKQQLYWLPSDRWVASQSVALAERDEFGRKGRYLTHSLVFAAADWQKLGSAPFGIWLAKPFLHSLEQASAQGDAGSGRIPPLRIAVNSNWQDGALATARTWDPSSLLALSRLAWQADSLQPAGQHIAVMGVPADIGRVLLTSYLVTPPEERRFLTFDTHAVGCNWGSQHGFWAQGFPPGERLRTSLVVDATSRRVDAGALPQAASRPYILWMEKTIIPGRLDDLLAWQDWAVALDAAIQGKSVDRKLLSSVSPQFMRHFAELNRDRIRRQMEDSLASHLPQELAQWVLERAPSDPNEQLRALMPGLTVSDVGDMVYEALLANPMPPRPATQKALAPLAKSHAGIQRLMHLWSGDLQAWRKELDRLSAQEYEALVTRLLAAKVVPSWKTMSPRHIDDWFHHAIPYTSSDELTEVASSLVECGGPAAADRLAGYVPQLQPTEQKSLYKWQKKLKGNQAPQLTAALEKALGESGLTVGRLKKLFGSRDD